VKRRDKKQIKDQQKPRPRHRFPVIDECQPHAETQTSFYRHSFTFITCLESCEIMSFLSLVRASHENPQGTSAVPRESCDTLLSTRLARRTPKPRCLPVFRPEAASQGRNSGPRWHRRTLGSLNIDSHRNEFFENIISRCASEPTGQLMATWNERSWIRRGLVQGRCTVPWPCLDHWQAP
jgi:hypothetical protein